MQDPDTGGPWQERSRSERLLSPLETYLINYIHKKQYSINVLIYDHIHDLGSQN